MQLRRMITVEVVYYPEHDGTPEDFRALSVHDALSYGVVVHDETHGDAVEPVAGPDGEP